MQTLDRTVEMEGRVLIVGLLHFRDKTSTWPYSGQVNQLSGYKNATDKAAMVADLIRRDWLEITEEGATGHRVKRIYRVTPEGRAAVAPPRRLPPLPVTGPIALPDDECEQAIYSHNLWFHKNHDRWPTGVERRSAFSPTQRQKWTRARRERAIQNLIDDGEVVRVAFRYGKGDTTLLIVPRVSPEYADMNGWVFYAPPVAT